MALPPKGDVTRPIYLAARSMLVLGILMCLVGALLLVLAIAFLGSAAASPTVPTRAGGGPPTATDWMIAIGFIFGLGALLEAGAGVAFVVCSIKIKQGRRWAVTTGIVLASVAVAFAGLMFLSSVAGLFVERFDSEGIISCLFVGLCFAGLVQLIVFLKRSYAGIHLLAHGAQRGFDVVLPTA